MGRTALVTGASSGIGLCYAKELAHRGYDLVIVSIEKDKNENLAKDLAREYRVKVFPVFQDLSEVSAAENLYDFCKNNDLQIDILINNAGILLFDTLSRTPYRKIDDIVALHVTTPTKLCKLFSEDMKIRRSGRILIMSSLTAYLPYPTISVYAATKSYLRSFAKSLWFELRAYGISVTTVFPGAVDTPLYNLDDAMRRTLRKCGIMMSPQQMAHRAIKRMLKGRKSYVPGVFTRIILLLTSIIPDRLICIVMRHPKLRGLFE